MEFIRKCLIFSTLFAFGWCSQWPIPYLPVESRPMNNPYCKAGLQPFCPTGKTVNSMPIMDLDDTIEIFAMKKPVWSFKYGPLLGFFNIMHDALGFRSTKTGLNYTMEWYELDQLFNCTFPHVLENGTFIWCNQGALCVYDGIEDSIWTEYGVLEKISEINGEQFNNFANWSITDNNTKVYYETWTVYNTSDINNPTTIMYFDSFDCASWVLRAIKKMFDFGANFNTHVHLNYTRINLYSYEPIFIGNYTTILNSGNQTLIEDIKAFYRSFQKRHDYIEQALEIYTYLVYLKRFYFYFNENYWLLHLKEPLIKITYDWVPLPATNIY